MTRPAPEHLAEAARQVNRALQAASDALGSVDRAHAWFLEQELEQFGGLTPLQMLQKGRVEDLLGHIATLKPEGPCEPICEPA